MRNLTWIRTIVIGQWITLIVWGGIRYFESRSLPRDVQIYMQNNMGRPTTLMGITLVCIEVILFVSYIIATIGILKKRNWSRRVFAYFTVSAAFLSLFAKPRVSGPIADTLGELHVFLMGVTIGILYFSSLDELYK